MATRYDRTGEPIDDPEPESEHNALCDAGWLGEDPAGRLIPCLTCRPHLAHRHDHLRRQLEGHRP